MVTWEVIHSFNLVGSLFAPSHTLSMSMHRIRRLPRRKAILWQSSKSYVSVWIFSELLICGLDLIDVYATLNVLKFSGCAVLGDTEDWSQLSDNCRGFRPKFFLGVSGSSYI